MILDFLLLLALAALALVGFYSGIIRQIENWIGSMISVKPRPSVSRSS
jgi:uncharacterized membrane protein required for colicin V production